MLEDSDVLSEFFSSLLLQGFTSSDLLDHLRSICPPQTVSCGGLLFRGVIDAGKETNKKEKLKMGRKKRRDIQCFNDRKSFIVYSELPSRGRKPMPSQRAKMDGDILRRDDVMNLDKTRWERISKFSMKRIFGPEGDQLWRTEVALGLSKNIWWNELVLRFTDLLYFWSLSFPHLYFSCSA